MVTTSMEVFVLNVPPIARHALMEPRVDVWLVLRDSTSWLDNVFNNALPLTSLKHNNVCSVVLAVLLVSMPRHVLSVPMVSSIREYVKLNVTPCSTYLLPVHSVKIVLLLVRSARLELLLAVNNVTMDTCFQAVNVFQDVLKDSTWLMVSVRLVWLIVKFVLMVLLVTPQLQATSSPQRAPSTLSVLVHNSWRETIVTTVIAPARPVMVPAIMLVVHVILDSNWLTAPSAWVFVVPTNTAMPAKCAKHALPIVQLVLVPINVPPVSATTSLMD